MTKVTATMRVQALPKQAVQPGARNARTGTFYAGASGHNLAQSAAQAGDVIEVNAGVYPNLWLDKSLTVRGAVLGERWKIDVTGKTVSAVAMAPGVSLTIEDAELYGNKTEYGNQAGIWPDAGPWELIVRRSKIHDCCNGILTGSYPDTSVLLEDSEFFDNGSWAAGRGHNVYIGTAREFTMRGCWSHMIKRRGAPGVPNWAISWGHLVKSRARKTTLIANRLTELGEGNRPIDLSNGGDCSVLGNLIEMSADVHQNNGYGQAVSFGVEESLNPARHLLNILRFKQNTVVNHGTAKKQFLFVRTDGQGIQMSGYEVEDNIFAGPGMPAVQQYTGAEGDIYGVDMTKNSLVPLSEMPGHADMDFKPSKPVAGSQNWVSRMYRHPAGTVERTDSDRGAV